jgi:hypothetical protein
LSAATGTFNGDISAASGTFEGNLSGSDISGGTISIGSENTIFKVESDGDMWIGHADQTSAPFRANKDGTVLCSDITITGGSQTIGSNYGVSVTGVLTATSADITGEINATSGSFTGAITGGTIDIGSPVKFAVTNTGVKHNSDITITGGSMTLGNVGISSSEFAAGLSGGGSGSPFYVSNTGLMSFGIQGGVQLRIQPSAQEFIWDGTALEFASAATGGDVHGWIQGDSQTIDFGYGSHTFEGVTMGAHENYIGVFQTWGSSIDPAYGVVLSATKGTGQYDERSILLHADEIINLNAGDGIYISDQSAPTPTTDNRLYAVSGVLHWDGTNVTVLPWFIVQSRPVPVTLVPSQYNTPLTAYNLLSVVGVGAL